MSRKIICAANFALILLLFCGCTDDSTDKIGIFYHSYKDDYTNSVRSHLDRAFADDDDIEHINYNAQGDGKKQLSQIQEAIKNGCKVLIVSACNENISEEITREAREANIPLIYFERPVSSKAVYDRGAFVAADYARQGKLQGRVAGKYILDNYKLCDINGDGRINYVIYRSDDTSTDSKLKSDTAIETIDDILSREGKPAIEYYDENNSTPYRVTPEGKTDYDGAKEHMLSAIEDYEEGSLPIPELVLANNDSLALGAAEALREKGLNSDEKRIPIFGIGGTDTAENALMYNLITATIKTDSVKMAEVVEKIADNFLDGDIKFDDIASQKIDNNWRVTIESDTESKRADI